MGDLINNNTPNAPCLGCEKRYLGCHSKCEEYIDFKNKSQEANQRIANKKAFEAVFYADKRKLCTKLLREKKSR